MEFVSTKEAADVVVLWLTPGSPGGGLFSSKGDPIELELSKNTIDVDYVNKMTSEKPTILAINFSNPWVIQEIDKGKAQTIIATFGTSTDALIANNPPCPMYTPCGPVSIRKLGATKLTLQAMHASRRRT